VLAQNDLKPVVKGMPPGSRHLIEADPHLALPVVLFAKTHDTYPLVWKECPKSLGVFQQSVKRVKEMGFSVLGVDKQF